MESCDDSDSSLASFVGFRFEWCQQNEVVPWPHPAAYESILPYLSLPGPVLASRLSKLDDRIMTSIFDIKSVLPFLRENGRTKKLTLSTRPLSFLRLDLAGTELLPTVDQPEPVIIEQSKLALISQSNCSGAGLTLFDSLQRSQHPPRLHCSPHPRHVRLLQRRRFTSALSNLYCSPKIDCFGQEGRT